MKGAASFKINSKDSCAGETGKETTMRILSKYGTVTIIFITIGLGLFTGAQAAFADTYTYDQYGRLTGVTYSDGSSVIYTYDAAGNRTVVVQSAP